MMRARKKLKSGFMFSIDAMIASLVALTMITSLYLYSSDLQTPNFNFSDLYHLAGDSIIALKDNGELKYAISHNSMNRLDSFFNDVVPNHICSSYSVYDSNHQRILESLSNGCSLETAEFNIQLESPFVYNEDFYSFEIVMWYK